MKYSVFIMPSEHRAVFNEVAEAVHNGLAELGLLSHPVVLAEATNEHTPIIFGWNVSDPNRIPPGSILYNLEQPGSPWLERSRLEPFRKYTFWDWNPVSLAELARLGFEVKHVPLGYTPSWTRIAPAPKKDIDVLFYGSNNDRRHSIYLKLCRQIKNVVWLYNVYGSKRDDAIARAKVVLNVHYYGNMAAFEIARVGYLLANRALVLSETSQGAEGFEDGVIFEPYYQLTRRAVELVQSLGDEQRAFLAEKGFQAIARRPMTEFLKGALT